MLALRHDPLIALYLMPTAKTSTAPASSAGHATGSNTMRYQPYNAGGGKSKGKGKKGQNRTTPPIPAELRGKWHKSPAGEPICYGFNCKRGFPLRLQLTKSKRRIRGAPSFNWICLTTKTETFCTSGCNHQCCYGCIWHLFAALLAVPGKSVDLTEILFPCDQICTQKGYQIFPKQIARVSIWPICFFSMRVRSS